MLSFSLRASLIALVASATAAAAAPSLTLKSSPSHLKVDGVTNLKVTTTVTNVGDETLKLLRDPRGILNPFPENTFSITGATGSHPLFKGAVVNHASGHLTRMRTDVRFPFLGQVQPQIRRRP